MKIKFLLLVLLFSNSAYSNYKLETVLDDLDDAWSLVFLSEDKILFTEKKKLQLKCQELIEFIESSIKDANNQ